MRGGGPKPAKPFRRIFLTAVLFLVLIASQTAGSNPFRPPEALAGQLPSSTFPQLSAQLTSYFAIKPKSPQPAIFAKAYTLIDGQTGEVILGKNAAAVLPIASTTKMVTALLASQFFDPSTVVTVSRQATLINGSKINLLTGEKITIENLLKGLLIQSGNDAAYQLAYQYSGEAGNIEPFVAKMNQFAQSHNLQNSTFGDPAGLDDVTGRSTAADLAQIGRLLITNPQLAAIVGTGSETVTAVDGSIRHELKNSNRLVDSADPLYLPGAIGIKTGFTPEAGHCLVAAFLLKNRPVVGVVMNTAEYTNTASASEMRKLFAWATTNLELKSY